MGKAFTIDPTATASFERIRGSWARRQQKHQASNLSSVKAVVIGGGTGAPMSIRTLLSMGIQTSAVVAMADDGGSTGALRELAGATPPGDIRKCLAAFADNPHDPLTRAFKYRFDFANQHTLGNLMLSALENATGSFPEAIAICEDLLHARGHVYPSTLDEVILRAKTSTGVEIQGQAKASHSETALTQVWLDSDSPITPYQPALDALRTADLIVLGPGSLFTSIIPNILVPGVLDAIRASKAKTVFVCSLADMQGETLGLSAEEHVQALLDHGMEGLIDYVLIHTPRALHPEKPSHRPGSVLASLDEPLIRPVHIDYEAAMRIQEKGMVVITRNLVDDERPTWHKPLALQEAFNGVISLCHLPRK